LGQYQQQYNYSGLELIEILAFILQMMDYEATMSQVGNNDILKELRTDTEKLRNEIAEIKEIIKELQQ
jgi:predicted ATP-grasp superfamily ATP-dependent carboligase